MVYLFGLLQDDVILVRSRRAVIRGSKADNTIGQSGLGGAGLQVAVGCYFTYLETPRLARL